jgi:hypothetical protein
MPKSSLPFDADDYAPVADRITLFYAKYPTGRLITELVHRDEHTVVFKALAYRDGGDAAPAATGWAEERVGDGEINEVACLENTETSAIGRALANLGFTASGERPSREEMEKAARARAVARPLRGWRVGETPARVLETRAPHGGETSERGDPLTSDLLDLLAEAERSGLAPNRIARLRSRIERGTVEPPAIVRLEVALRRWLALRDHGR